MIRPARIEDIDALVVIEELCFETDRLSRRSFRHLLTRAHATTLVEEDAGVVRGYVMVLFHRGTSLARIYSVAVHPQHQGTGVAKRLLAASEEAALANDCLYLRLEVRKDNLSTIKLYESLGYRQFGVLGDYYEDDMDALRYEKALGTQLAPDLAIVPYYEQTLDFTCGPSALMMAMRALDGTTAMNRRHEIRLWRESTTVFMTSGLGGCGPFGLALAAHRRGFDVAVYVNGEGALFVDSVRSDEKKAVIKLVHQDFKEEIRRAGVPIAYRRISLDEVQEAFEDGAIAIILISSYSITREKSPHWVVVTGFDDRFIYVHDSFVDHADGRTATDSMNIPITRKDFERMAAYGKTGQRAALLIRKPAATARRRRP